MPNVLFAGSSRPNSFFPSSGIPYSFLRWGALSIALSHSLFLLSCITSTPLLFMPGATPVFPSATHFLFLFHNIIICLQNTLSIHSVLFYLFYSIKGVPGVTSYPYFRMALSSVKWLMVGATRSHRSALTWVCAKQIARNAHTPFSIFLFKCPQT